MRTDSLLILKGGEIHSLLLNREAELIDVVRRAYETHGEGDSSLPHSVFLRFPEDERNRIIALPAYLGGEFGNAGIKWIASFPGNLEAGLERASAVMILNSTQTGQPQAIMEASIISAKRTAASAALAAQVLHGANRAKVAGLLGCGLINFEIAAFLLAARPDIEKLVVFDVSAERAEFFKTLCVGRFKEIEVEVARDAASVYRQCPLISFATNAGVPHIEDLSACQPGSTILHISLRDLSPQIILSCDNIVDDVDHVCRAQTSIHLAEQSSGNRDFIRGTLADVLKGRIEPRRDADGIVVFSPFGLGVLDLAVGKFALEAARQQNLGSNITEFLPDTWHTRYA